MRPAKIIGRIAAGVALAGVGAATLGWTIAHRLTAPVNRRRYDLRIHEVEQDGAHIRVVLDRTSEMTATGIYNLWFEHGGWAQLGPEIEDRDTNQITRTVTGTSDGLKIHAGERVSWSGIYYATPAYAELDAHEVVIDTAAGPCPAWKIDGSSTWAIHIHGLGSTRSGTLRGVQVATELGYSALVVSYRNDGEGPTVGTGRSTLGWTETDDVEEAVDYAVRHGAERIVLFGWSMGGAIAIQLALRPHLVPLIAGLVLDSPALDWSSVIRANCTRAGLPARVGDLAIPWLNCKRLSRFLGLPAPIPVGAMSFRNWGPQHTVPTVILHGTNDDSVPGQLSLALEQLRPNLVEANQVAAGHTLSWNRDPVAWRTTVTLWLQATI